MNLYFKKYFISIVAIFALLPVHTYAGEVDISTTGLVLLGPALTAYLVYLPLGILALILLWILNFLKLDILKNPKSVEPWIHRLRSLSILAYIGAFIALAISPVYFGHVVPGVMIFIVGYLAYILWVIPRTENKKRLHRKILIYSILVFIPVASVIVLLASLFIR